MTTSEQKSAGERRATIAEAIAAWEAKGPTSLTVALMAEALYGAREARPDCGPDTHDGNHAPLPNGARLAPGFCEGCDALATSVGGGANRVN